MAKGWPRDGTGYSGGRRSGHVIKAFSGQGGNPGGTWDLVLH